MLARKLFIIFVLTLFFASYFLPSIVLAKTGKQKDKGSGGLDFNPDYKVGCGCPKKIGGDIGDGINGRLRGNSCTIGTTRGCTDQYGCSGTETCQGNGLFSSCNAQEYTLPACVGTSTPCSTINSQSSCSQQQSCIWNANNYCTGTAADCSSFPSSCMNSQGYAQQGCSSGSQVVCGSSTTVSIIPNTGLVVNQQVALTIAFNDSRYLAGHNAYFNLTIDGVAWNSANGCGIGGVNVTPVANGINTACTWQGLAAPCTSTSVNGYLQVTTQCNLPFQLAGTTHILVATPTFYSGAQILKAGTTQFTTAGTSHPLQDFLGWIASFLNIAARLRTLLAKA